MSPLSTLALVGGLAAAGLVTGCSQDAPTAPADFARGGAPAWNITNSSARNFPLDWR